MCCSGATALSSFNEVQIVWPAIRFGMRTQYKVTPNTSAMQLAKSLFTTSLHGLYLRRFLEADLSNDEYLSPGFSVFAHNFC